MTMAFPPSYSATCCPGTRARRSPARRQARARARGRGRGGRPPPAPPDRGGAQRERGSKRERTSERHRGPPFSSEDSKPRTTGDPGSAHRFSGSYPRVGYRSARYGARRMISALNSCGTRPIRRSSMRSHRSSPMVREVELVPDRLREQLGRVADLRELDAGVRGERAQCAEVAARGGEALLVAVEVEQVDHELDRRLEPGAARDLLELTEVRRQLGVIEVGRQLRPRREIAELGDDRGAAGREPARDPRDRARTRRSAGRTARARRRG